MVFFGGETRENEGQLTIDGEETGVQAVRVGWEWNELSSQKARLQEAGTSCTGRLVFWLGEAQLPCCWASRLGDEEGRVWGPGNQATTGVSDWLHLPMAEVLFSLECFPQLERSTDKSARAAEPPMSMQQDPCRCLDLGHSTSHHDAAASTLPAFRSLCSVMFYPICGVLDPGHETQIGPHSSGWSRVEPHRNVSKIANLPTSYLTVLQFTSVVTQDKIRKALIYLLSTVGTSRMYVVYVDGDFCSRQQSQQDDLVFYVVFKTV